MRREWSRRVRALAAVAALPLAGCGSSAGPTSHASGPPSTTAPPTSTSTTTAAATATTVDPGSLPQTDTVPSATTGQFTSEMAAFWLGVTSGTVGPAMPAFFPLRAYEQVKAISNAASDFQSRLIDGYALDIQAAHNITGSSATLLRVDVPTQYIHWVVPNTCYNRYGYYEVPNSRVVFQAGGVTKSFGIASMISWRGVWYIVHLGAVVRSGGGGQLDDPAIGPGVSRPSSTC